MQNTMYHYTPKASVLRELQVSMTGRWWDKEYTKANEVLLAYGIEASFTNNCLLRNKFVEVSFYSPNKLRLVPICGFLFPAEMFTETKI